MAPTTITESAFVRVVIVDGARGWLKALLQVDAPYAEVVGEAGAEFFLDKSFGFERLADILRELARKSGLNCDERKIL